MSEVCVGLGGVWGSYCAGVVAVAGRKFMVAACKIPPPHSFFITPGTQVIMTQQDSLLGQGSVGGLWVSLQGHRCVE